MPQAVLEGVAVLGHVAGQRFGTDGKVDARPLTGFRRKRERCELISVSFVNFIY